jgi:hypothetical protein
LELGNGAETSCTNLTPLARFSAQKYPELRVSNRIAGLLSQRQLWHAYMGVVNFAAGVWYQGTRVVGEGALPTRTTTSVKRFRSACASDPVGKVFPKVD